MYHNLKSFDTGDVDTSYGSDSSRPLQKAKLLLARNGGMLVAILGLAAVITVIVVVVQLRSIPPPAPPPTFVAVSLNVSGRRVEGFFDSDIYVFQGMPYALPPVGKRRWQPPQPMEAEWPNRVYASNHAPCFQYSEEISLYIGSEDCLTINVWSPQLGEDAGLDVMVYVHGGGLMTGSGGGMPGDRNVSRQMNTVFVGFNYRLNAFGFMALEALSWNSIHGASGNYGFMDQIMALKWVQRNIAAFGGNPKKVTVFGEGSGATSIVALLSLPETKTLFQKAWLISPSPKFDVPLRVAQKSNLDFVNNTGCLSEGGDLHMLRSCLYKLSPQDIAAALPRSKWMNGHYSRLPELNEESQALAIVDGDLLRVAPLQAWKNGSINDVPLLIGSAAQEADDTSLTAGGGWPAYDRHVRRRLAAFGGDAGGETLALYPHAATTPARQLSTAVSDMRAVCPVGDLAALAAHCLASPVHRYVATHAPRSPPPTPAFRWRRRRGRHHAFHAVDLLAFLGGTAAIAAPPDADDERFVATVRAAVAEFVATGAVRAWGEYPAALALVGREVQLRDGYHHEQCRFWADHAFYPRYAWMN